MTHHSKIMARKQYVWSVIASYGLTDSKINHALYLASKEAIASYVTAMNTFLADDSVENFNACMLAERRILREATLWHRILRWCNDFTYRVHFLGLSETRLHAEERSAGMISIDANNF